MAGNASEAGSAGAGGDAAGLDTGLIGLAMIAAVHQKVAEPAQLAHQLGLRTGKHASARDILRAARRLELKAISVD